MKIETNGDFVSVIRHDLKALNKDDYVSARYILSVGRSYSDYIINNRPLFKLFRDRGVFITCDCIKLKQVKKHECDIAEFRECSKIMVSKTKLPKILVGRNGYLIEFVTNIVNGEEYEPLRNAVDFLNSKKRQFGNNFKYYYISGDFLYLLNSTAERVNMSAAFLEKCKDCEDGCDECKSKLDEKFIIPDEYMSGVLEQTLNRILSGNKKIIEDSRPDTDPNQKTRTQ